MEDFDLPYELEKEFYGSYRSKYYKGYWELMDWENDTCDFKVKAPHWHNNELTIVLHPYYRNSNEYWFFFKLEDDKIKLEVLGTRYNGMDTWYSEGVIPFGKVKINKVKKYLEQRLKEM